MRSEQLRAALISHLEAVSAHLQAELTAGAEVPFELVQQGGRGRRPALCCYRPLTREFIAEREHALRVLPTSRDALQALAEFDGLERYLLTMGIDLPPSSESARLGTALAALTEDAFGEQSDFELRAERVDAALARLETARGAAPSEVTLLATLHGMAIASGELAVTGGLRIIRAGALTGLPACTPVAAAGEALAGEPDEGAHGEQHEQLLVILETQHAEPRAAIEQGRAALAELVRALRLFGDGRIALGKLGWVRVADGAWHPCALGEGGRPHGILLVTAEQEDELRGFCNLIAHRSPREGALAWALRRYELGCERELALEGLSDHLLALRALLEPQPAGPDALARRLASLCASEHQREALQARVEEALELELACRAGHGRPDAGTQALAGELADHLRALLRDVICGHLQPDLAALAEQIGAETPTSEGVDGEAPAARADAEEPSALSSLEEIFSDPRQAEEILDVLI